MLLANLGTARVDGYVGTAAGTATAAAPTATSAATAAASAAASAASTASTASTHLAWLVKRSKFKIKEIVEIYPFYKKIFLSFFCNLFNVYLTKNFW